MKELDKAYDAQKYEDSIYTRWEESGFFNPDNLSGEPFTIVFPPPNVTGILHNGHALEHSLMDTIIRYQRMCGKKTLLLPGTDHAAVATQAKVEGMLMKEGVADPRKTLGRDGLVEKIRAFAEGSKESIISQVKKMGSSADWSRLAYTFDDKRSEAVNEAFLRMYNDGLIYRGHRVIHWSVKGQSTCSEDELEMVERTAALYTFTYSADFPIPISTTRPETKFGDTAVAVHPKDSRYAQYIGQVISVRFCGVDLQIKVIGDEHVDPHFGTGALGVTPAHSHIDFEIYERQKAKEDPIDLIQVIGEDGLLMDCAGSFAKKDVVSAREQVVAQLRKDGLLTKEEEVRQHVATHGRFKDVVEPLPKTQWFVAVNKKIPGRNKTLKELVQDAVADGHNGDPSKKITLVPEGQVKRHEQRIKELHDWCISRQIWWGHRIPVWYNGEEIFVGPNAPTEKWVQDEDTLDTWFSAALWTFSTLGWPNNMEDVDMFHPTSFMQMGHEILFLWFQRMILMSTYLLDDIPFSYAYIHGLVRNEQGKKFSKSDGNTADPVEVIKKYGTDALRFSLIAGITPGNDQRFYGEKVAGARNLVNKLWNICRFTLTHIKETDSACAKPEPKTLSDEWILSRLNQVTKEVTQHMNEYELSAATEVLRDFTWNELADWYLEIAKIEGEKSAILNYILNTTLKLWHPFMPFVTEVIWQEVCGKEDLLMVAPWPKPLETDIKDSQDFLLIQKSVTKIRNLRAENNIPPGKKLVGYVKSGSNTSVIEENTHIILSLARLESLTVVDAIPEDTISFVEAGVEYSIDFAGAVDKDKEQKRIQKEIDSVSPYIQSLEKKLAGDFAQKAPEAVVSGEKKKLAEAKEKLEKLQEQLQ